MRHVLDVIGVTVRFGGVEALAGVRLSVRRGEVVGLIGANGAGKTTLCDCISGIRRPDSGAIDFDGRRVDRVPSHRRARLGIARTFQSTALFDGLSVFDNIRTAAEHCGSQPTPLEAVHRLVEEFDLGAYADVAASALSTGYRRRVDLARAMACKPKLLLLDEPTAGMHPSDADAVMAGIAAISRKDGLSVLWIEHEMPVVAAHADRVVVLDRGRVVAEGAPAEVLPSGAVVDAYPASTS
jgi:ABC-type branched-subunit amino acid transport system ATPase component